MSDQTAPPPAPTSRAIALTAIATAVAVLTLVRILYGDALSNGQNSERLNGRLERLEERQDERRHLLEVMDRRQQYLLLLTRDIARRVGIDPPPVPMTDVKPPAPFVHGLMDAYAGELPPGVATQ